MGRNKSKEKKQQTSRTSTINGIVTFIVGICGIIYYVSEGVVYKFLKFVTFLIGWHPELKDILEWGLIWFGFFLSLYIAYLVLRFTNFLESRGIKKGSYLLVVAGVGLAFTVSYRVFFKKYIQEAIQTNAFQGYVTKGDKKKNVTPKPEIVSPSKNKEYYIMKLDEIGVHFPIASFCWKKIVQTFLGFGVGVFIAYKISSFFSWIFGSPQRDVAPNVQ